MREIGCCLSCRFRFVDRFVFFAAGKNRYPRCSDAESDSAETDKKSPRCQKRVHQAIIDMSLANPVARKFGKERTIALVPLLDELNLDRYADIILLARVSEKSSDGRASDRTIIASEIINVHADKSAGELLIHVARICE